VGNVLDFDLTASTRLNRNWLAEFRAEDVPALMTIEGAQQGDQDAGVRVCHVTVIASCGAEAIVFARCVIDRRWAIAVLLGVSIKSLSWLASDVAPVGVLMVGDLNIAPVEADVWVTVASLARLQGCNTTRLLKNSARLAGVEYVTIALDRPDRNVVRFPSPPAESWLPLPISPT
jgi:hypothetical protein